MEVSLFLYLLTEKNSLEKVVLIEATSQQFAMEQWNKVTEDNSA